MNPAVEPHAAALPKPHRRALGALAWISRAALVLAALLAMAVCIAWLVLQWAILPRIEHWRPELEQRATQALGLELRIGAIEVTDAGVLGRWARTIELRDVRLLRPADAAGQAPPGLTLPRVRARLSPASLLPGWDGRWRLRFDQLLIEGAELEVRRERDGRILVAGFEPKPSQGDDGAAADWFFSQHEVAIRGGRLTWTDAMRADEPLAFEAVDLVVRNGVRRHALRIDATPPAGFGERFSLRGEFVQPVFGEIVGWGEVRPESSQPVRRALLARPGDWRRWRGQVYAELPAFDIAPLRAHLALPLDVLQARGALRAWVDVQRAAPDAATLDLALRDVSVQPFGAPEPLAFARIDGRLGARIDRPAAAPGEPADEPLPWRGPMKAELRTRGFGFETTDGLVWPAAQVDVDARFDTDGKLVGGALKTPRIDLGLLAKLFSRVPVAWVGADAHVAVAELGLEGIAQGVDARWQGPVAAPQSFALKGRVEGLALAAPAMRAGEATVRASRPGVRHLDVDLDATEAGGEALLAVRDGEIEWPGLLETPRLPLDRLEARVQWRRTPGRDDQPDAIDLRVGDVKFANADAQGEGQARWQRNAGTSALGTLDLTGRAARLDATAIPRYLPLRLPENLRSYLDRAIQAGTARAIDVRLKGDLREFPFAQARKPGANESRAGEFRVVAQLDGVRFAYEPGDPDWDPKDPKAHRPWPPFTDIKGELVFDRQSMELRKLQGRLGTVGSGGFQLSGVHGGIKDLAHGATLALEGTGRGPLADALAYIQSTPIERWTGGVLSQAQAGPAPGAPATASAQAPAELQLALELPLTHIDQSKVRGSVVLAGNDLRLKPEVPPLGNARARINFTEHGFDLNGGARMLGGDATVEGGAQADGAVRLAIQGTASIDGLRRQLGGGEPLPAARGPASLAMLSGQSAYRLAFAVARGQPEWLLTSNLVGTAIDLPAPLKKRAEASLPLQVRLAPASDAGGAERDLLRIDLGPEGARLAQAVWLREPGANGTRVLRGAIGIGDELPPLADVIVARVVQERLDLDAWHVALDPPGPAGAAAATASAAATAGATGYAPGTVALRAQTLTAGSREWHRVDATVTRGTGADEGVWRANLDATELQGAIEYRAPGTRGGGAEGRVQARLARLALPKQGSDGSVNRLLDTTTATRLPALDIAVDDLEVAGKRLGRVEVEAVNRGSEGEATAGEWTLNRLRVGVPGALLTGSGRWAAAPGGKRRTSMDLRLDVSDAGALLARFGQPDVIKGAKGHLSGQLQWNGSPMSIDYPSLGGQLHAEFESGQFLKADPGIAKLLGVLSLQSLPRRLLFDFRDVFEKGFVFDSANGDAEIAAGVASTRNLRMKGVQATVLMEGQADFARETQDLHAWVVPEFNAGAASLAVAAINPAVGIGSFLAQLFLRRPLAEANTREFHITGPWASPKVERIERTRAAPDVDDAGAAAKPPPKDAAKDTTREATRESR